MLFSSLQPVLDVRTVTMDNYKEYTEEIKETIILSNAKPWQKRLTVKESIENTTGRGINKKAE